MDTGALKKFAQAARRQLREQVAAKLDRVFKTDSAEIRERATAIKELKEQVDTTSQEAVIDKVAYIWFNRFCALRFMDMNRYTRMGAVSPTESFTQPEILQEAKQGHIDDSLDRFVDRQKVFDLLSGTAPSSDPQQEAYRLLLVAVCNFYNSAMPFLFEKIADYTELLMPDDLLSESSVLTAILEAMSPEACQDVEVIGWLYQFYISEKKEEVDTKVKKGGKVEAPEIPPKTALFTPHWIVRYLVENSLGRLWMLNRPGSRLIEQMDYYIKPEQPETDFLRIKSPEEIKICDPACGSGHMLVYAFDLLYAIYEEEGYEASEIPEKILTNNLYGIEIDERAGELAAFALTMKARFRYRRFFRNPAQPNICVLENIQFSEGELKEYMDFVGRDLFTEVHLKTLHQFEEADNFGSLIRPEIMDVDSLLKLLESKNIAGNLFLSRTHQIILQALSQVDYLSPKYHVVVTNPPYMGKGMNGRLGKWARRNFPDSKADLFAMFIERNLDLAQKFGLVAMITMQSWMFLSSFEKLRIHLLNQGTILSLAHLGARAFDSIGGEVVSTAAFVLDKSNRPDHKGGYLRLVTGNSEATKEAAIHKAIMNPDCGWFYRASSADFKKIPGSPIVYWATETILELFQRNNALSDRIETREGLTTGCNDLFLRLWHEVELDKIGFAISDHLTAQDSRKRYFTYIKGGDFRRWSGNFEYVVNWFNDGEELKAFKDPATGRIRSHNYNGDYAFKAGFTWSGISSGIFAVRHVPPGFMFDAKGPMGFARKDSEQPIHEAFLNSAVTNHLVKMLAPTLDFKLGHILNLPTIENVSNEIGRISKAAIRLSSQDWNSYETSWDFSTLPLLQPDYHQSKLKATYQKLHTHWQEMTLEIQRLEEENNHIFIESYGLQDELTPEVPLSEITLTCNPYYRYGGDKSEEELETLLLADTMKEFISYAVGCMFGRFSLDKPGLILSNQDETIQEYLNQIPEPTFPADDDNVIPILDGDWFTDDISERFRKFLRVTFGDKHYEENLKFIEEAIGKNIRKYFTGYSQALKAVSMR